MKSMAMVLTGTKTATVNGVAYGGARQFECQTTTGQWVSVSADSAAQARLALAACAEGVGSELVGEPVEVTV